MDISNGTSSEAQTNESIKRSRVEMEEIENNENAEPVNSITPTSKRSKNEESTNSTEEDQHSVILIENYHSNEKTSDCEFFIRIYSIFA